MIVRAWYSEPQRRHRYMCPVMRAQRSESRSGSCEGYNDGTTAYALLTVGTITFGGVLLKIITDETMRNQLLQIILAIIKFLLSNFGVFAG